MARELLLSVTKNDLEIQTFCAGGKGGQHQNKTETGVRIIHKASGAVGEARDSRSQHANKIAAFDRMAKSDRFQKWLRVETSRILSGKTIDQKVEEQMNSKNLKLEIRGGDGKWEVGNLEDLE
jgi:hypothetical protein